MLLIYLVEIFLYLFFYFIPAILSTSNSFLILIRINIIDYTFLNLFFPQLILLSLGQVLFNLSLFFINSVFIVLWGVTIVNENKM